MTSEPMIPDAGVIEVFSFDCPLCEDAVQAATEAVRPCGCAVRVRPWEEGPRHVEASEGGIHPVPSLAVDGRVVFSVCPKPGEWQLPQPEEG